MGGAANKGPYNSIVQALTLEWTSVNKVDTPTIISETGAFIFPANYSMSDMRSVTVCQTCGQSDMRALKDVRLAGSDCMSDMRPVWHTAMSDMQPCLTCVLSTEGRCNL